MPEDKTILWAPKDSDIKHSRMLSFMNAVQVSEDVCLKSFEDLHAWSVQNPEVFWSLVFDFCKVKGRKGSPYAENLLNMLDATFFPNGMLNFAENCLRRNDDSMAIIFTQENRDDQEVTWRDLFNMVARLSAQLRSDGVRKGDRICAVAANVPETVVCMLATTTIGAIWSSVSPDFGVEGVLERFSQIEPKVFFHSNWYINKGRLYDVSAKMTEIELHLREKSPGLISISLSDDGFERYSAPFAGLTSIEFEPTNFNDPAFIMFSSGTTGKPKCIVHRHGALLQLMKEHQLHSDIKPEDRVFYYTTTTWMMWNWLVSCLASEATVLLFEGNPFFPSCNALFDFASRYGCTFFGVSAKFIDALRTASDFVTPRFEKVRTIGSTGSPLVPESFDFVYSKIKADVNLASLSGGTDILSCFMLGCPIKPVKRGFIQARGLGMDVQVWDPDTGKSILKEKGELVCCKPFPSQPVMFWGDTAEKAKYRETYFSDFPNVWKHGDFCLMDEDGHIFMYGRSDATLKPGGVRIGTAEIYRAVESLPFVKEGICCGLELKPGEEVVALFVSLKDDAGLLTEDMREQIRKAVGSSATRHHVPKVIEQVDDIPRTKSGKIVELAVKNVLHHQQVKNLNALSNPEALKQFEKFAVKYPCTYQVDSRL